jgi:SAM-dependent methyltransferase
MASNSSLHQKILFRMLRKYALVRFTPSYAASYRLSDNEYYNRSQHTGKFEFIRNGALSYQAPTILDMGCGTGRYFNCCNNARFIVAFDLSRAMLLQAKNPVAEVLAPFSLLNSSVDEIEFKSRSFDMVYCMGLFGDSLPLESWILIKVAKWLKPGGCFCFDVIEQWFGIQSPGTWRSRLAEKIRPYFFGPAKAYLDAKLMGFTIDRSTLRDLVSQYFDQVEIRDITGASGGRLDLLCAAKLGNM